MYSVGSTGADSAELIAGLEAHAADLPEGLVSVAQGLAEALTVPEEGSLRATISGEPGRLVELRIEASGPPIADRVTSKAVRGVGGPFAV